MAAKPAIIVVAFQISSSTNGGIESISQFLTGTRKYRPIVVTNLENGQTQSWRASGIPTYVLAAPPMRGNPVIRMSRLGAAILRFSWRLFGIMRSNGTSLVLANDPLAMQLVYPLARLGLASAAFCLRGVPDPHSPPRAWKYRAFFEASQHLFFLSRDMARVWLSLAPSNCPSSVTYVAVPDRLFETGRPRTPERPSILVCGRLSNVKGQLEFLEKSCPALVAAGLDIVLAGDDFADEQEYGDACRKAAADLGPSVKLIGHQADLLPLYTKATILVLPSRIEGLGRVRAEAMAAGCPVISFDVCSSEELLGGGAGIVVPQGDWDALTQAILQTVSDPKELEKLSVQSRRRAEELFRLEQVVRHYEQGLDQMRER